MTKSYGTKKPKNPKMPKVPKTKLYHGEPHEVIKVDNSNGVYVLRSKTGEEIKVPFSEYLPSSN